MTDDQTPAAQAGDESARAGRVEEVWTFAGRRESDGKKYYAWQDGHGQERYYAKVPANTIGGRYAVLVTRDGERVSVYPEARYTGERVDEGTRREMEALDIAASALLAALARDRNDARRKALDDAVQPFAEIAAKLRFGHERDAFLAYVIRRLSQRW
ncbi:hypothetical protein [Actinoplanes sp. NBRC 103695]|uniref:hypothetical protein n=1 Tax=Actinoplanes sp. NBRC 103695 TaxID=3032202 RepID=UPI0024A4C245|nr:hypothetical protein [Actinoplanes sp. NBRC 103695]GLY98835.1 hypothetical protein Acsp02_60890 [Actinoplanes sp. NBRC 103695]